MIQNHITSLELSQKLKELGVPQRSEFEWSTTESGNNISLGTTLTPDHPNYKSPFYKSYSAFLSSELGEMLPFEVTLKEKSYLIQTRFYEEYNIKKYSIAYWNHKDGKHLTNSKKELKEVNARAKMLIYLIENKLIQVESL